MLRTVLIIFLIATTNSISAQSFFDYVARHEFFIQKDLAKLVDIPDGAGPGSAIFNMKEIILEIEKFENPIVCNTNDFNNIRYVLDNTGRKNRKTDDYLNKILIEFKIKNSFFTGVGKFELFVNNKLKETIAKHIKVGDKCYLLITLTVYHHFDNTGLGLINEFMTNSEYLNYLAKTKK